MQTVLTHNTTPIPFQYFPRQNPELEMETVLAKFSRRPPTTFATPALSAPPKVTVLCDVDGVLADLVGAICVELPGRSERDFKHYDFAKCLTKPEVEAAYALMTEPGFSAKLPWYAGARRFVFDLGKHDDLIGEVLYVTSPFEQNPTWIDGRKCWLEPTGTKRSNVLAVSHKFKKFVRGDVLIEDHPGTIADWLEADTTGRSIGLLFDRPWNQHTSDVYPHGRDTRRMIRVYDYEQALFEILAHAHGGSGHLSRGAA